MKNVNFSHDPWDVRRLTLAAVMPYLFREARKPRPKYYEVLSIIYDTPMSRIALAHVGSPTTYEAWREEINHQIDDENASRFRFVREATEND